jgi:FAD/FMN-containing dehydrogenase
MLATQSKLWSRVVEWSGAEVRSAVELWPAAQEDFALMERLKLLFDPQRQLNRGRLYGRL